MKPWEVLRSWYLVKRWWMNLRVDRVALPGGHVLDEFHVLEYPDWVCVLCHAADGGFVLVRQYRHAIEQVALELPAGVIERGEDPVDAARRELLEETGFTAERWTYVGRCAPEPGRHTNYAHIVVAHEAVQIQDQDLDATEHIAVCRLSAEELHAAALSGELVHGIHMAAYFWARQRGLFAVSEAPDAVLEYDNEPGR